MTRGNNDGGPARGSRATAGWDDVRALTSDVWYTLLYLPRADQERLEQSRARAWVAALVRGGLARTRALHEAARLESWARKQEAIGWTPTISEQSEWLTRTTGVRLEGDAMGATMDRLLAKAPIRVAPHAVRSLGALRDGGVHLGLVSNLLHETGPAFRGLLGALGLLDCFESVVLSCEHPWSKPRPEPFWCALTELGVAPAAAVHVGDLVYDILGARTAGMRTLLFTGLHRYEPARLAGLADSPDPHVGRVRRWSEVPPLLLDSSATAPRRAPH
jgi:FMN phosphatase YigB (HAD superfamily)